MYTLTEENYIKAIFHLQNEIQAEVSTNAIADKVDTKPSSVTDMVKKLAEKHVLTYTKYKGVLLTQQGIEVAASIIRKHRLWEVFLVEKLNYHWDEVHVIAEQLEHIKSDTLIDRLDSFLDYPDFDPHGDPIPDKNGRIKPSSKKLLIDLLENESGICVGVKESSDDFLQFLDKKGIGIGVRITILQKEVFDKSMTIKIGENKLFVSDKVTENLYIQTT